GLNPLASPRRAGGPALRLQREVVLRRISREGNSTTEVLFHMALLNRKVDYALLILSYLRHTPEGGCARVIAGRFGLSRPFVANILKQLCQKGFVASHRGVKGGYLLRPEASGRTLAELMDSLGDAFYLAECNRAAPDECCPLFTACPVKGPVAEV